ASTDQPRAVRNRARSSDRSGSSPIEPVRKAGAAEVRIGSDRSFGFVMAAFLAIVGLWPLLRDDDPGVWALALSAAFAVCAVARPGLLHPLNQVWFQLGLLLHTVVSPVILALLFFTVVTPVAALMRAMRVDVLGLHLDRATTSYWVDRSGARPGP